MSGYIRQNVREGLIKEPGARLLQNLPLKFAAAHHGGAHRSVYAELNLTSMVDMLTILVVFLLQTFSATGDIMMVQKSIVLPEAQQFKELELAPVIAVNRESVTLDGRPVASADQLNTENTTDWKIPELHDQLVTLKNNFKLLNPSQDFSGTVIVQADKNIDFKVLKKVMYSCSVAGYTNINFAVNQKAKQ